MEPIRVMIVDDEILAVEDIIDLISWNELGFEIVATAKNGRQALDKYSTVRPEVIISDIRMPVMDGLEMSKAVLALEKNVKILLLTGYEEFEYAKKAVKIGVLDYILKNEINKSVLSSKVLELKEVILKEKYESSLLLRNLLKDFITGNAIDRERLPKTILPQNEQAYLILFELDLSFLTVISDFTEDRSNVILDVNQLAIYMDSLPEGFRLIEMVPVEKHRVILMLGQSNSLSEYETSRKLHCLARRIQQNFKDDRGMTLSSYVYSRKIKMDKYQEVYRQFRHISKYKVFFGREQLFDAENIRLETSRAEIDIDEREFTQNIHELNFEKTRLFIEEMFASSMSSGYNLEGIISVIKEFLHILQNFKRTLYRADAEFNSPEATVDEKMWYKADDIRHWFVDQFMYVIKGVEKASRYKLSWEVQKCLEYIHKHYFKEDLTIGEVAGKIGLSVTHLSVKLKKETGMTFLEYLTNYRIDKAKKLLASENCKVYEISNRIGYKTSQYFSKVFYKATGKTPVDYRKEVT